MFSKSPTSASVSGSPSTAPSLVVTAFQSSLENLLLEATKNRNMTPLRDAVHSARIKGHSAEDVFHTFVLACDTLHSRRSHRALLLRSLSDLGKMVSLRLLPVSATVVHVICDLVRKLLRGGSGGSVNALQNSITGSNVTIRGNGSVGEYSAGPTSLEGTLMLEGNELSLMASGYFGGEITEFVSVIDEELQMRILQTLMAYLSACPQDNAGLADIVGLLFTIYIMATPGSMVEATCSATIEQQTHALLRGFRHGGAVDNGASLTAQIQSVSYLKDVCAICSGHVPKWLRLGSNTTSSVPVPIVAPPRRLRILLLRTLTTHFAEGEPIGPSESLSIFFAQCLNEDVVPLALGYGTPRSNAHDTADALVEFLTHDEGQEDEEEFHLAQKLAVTLLTKALPVMRHTAPAVLRHHANILKLSDDGDGGADGTRRMGIIVALWRKALTDHDVLRQLLLLHSTIPSGSNSSNASHTGPTGIGAVGGVNTASQEDVPTSPRSPGSRVEEATMGTHAFATLVAAAARLLAHIMISSEGIVDIDGGISTLNSSTSTHSPPHALQRHAQSPQQNHHHHHQRQQQQQQQVLQLHSTSVTRDSHPATAQAGTILAFLTIFAQSLARVAVELSTSSFSTSPTSSTSQQRQEVASVFTTLHSTLLRCFALAAQHLQGDDVIHTILKGTTHLVQTCCAFRLATQRDGYLQIFLTRLFMRQPEVTHMDPVASTRTVLTKEPSEDRQEEHNVPSRGRVASAAISKAQQQEQRIAAANRSLEALQDKLYVLNCVISVASSMVEVLDDGWQPVASCLLVAGPLLQRYRDAAEQRHQYLSTGNAVALQDAARSAEHVRDALHLLFINGAFAPDNVITLRILLSHFVAAANGATLPTGWSHLSAIRSAGECCTLALLTATWRGASAAQLRTLWAIVRPLYANVLDTDALEHVTNDRASHTSGRFAEDLAATLTCLVEDVAVVMALLCDAAVRGLRGSAVEESVPLATGPYTTSGLVARLMLLSASSTASAAAAAGSGSGSGGGGGGDRKMSSDTGRVGGTKRLERSRVQAEIHKENKPVEKEKAGTWWELLASPAELLSVGYTQLRRYNGPDPALRAASLEASLALLREILRLVQAIGEGLRGNAWVYILRILREAATLDAPGVEMVMESPALAESPNSTSMETYRSPVNLAAAAAGNIKQSVGVAFRALETIQHSCITSLDDEGLRQLIRCGGAFMTHSVAGAEARLSINLSAVQQLWSVADYIVAREEGPNDSEASFSQGRDDVLWCTLLLQLYDGCLDTRPEVRQSALKTVFSLVQAYGGRLSADCWDCVLQGVMVPLFETTLAAGVACAIPELDKTGDKLNSQRRPSKDSSADMTPLSVFQVTTLEEKNIPDGTPPLEREIQRREALLSHLAANPAMFDDMRVTIMDSACRVFVTHHPAVRRAMRRRATGQFDPKSGDSNDVEEETESDLGTENDDLHALRQALHAFTQLCAAARLVARGTNGEAAALAAVRALRALAVEANGLLLGPSAWRATEGILTRSKDSAHTARTQCTAAVVATIVTALADMAERFAENSIIPSNVATSQSTSLSLLQQIRHAFTHGSGTSFSMPTGSSGLTDKNREMEDVGEGEGEVGVGQSYFGRFRRVVEIALLSPATVDSYFFPGRVQTAVRDAWRRLWPVLDAIEHDAILGLVLHQFPSRHVVQQFVTQNVSDDNSEKNTQRRPISLHEAFPPGAHPAFLTALMEFLRGVVDDYSNMNHGTNNTGDDVTSGLRVAPGVVQVAGVLLMLEYASPSVLTTPGPGVPFDISPTFFDAADECLRYFLTNVLWSLPRQTATNSASVTLASVDPTLVNSCRRAGLLAFATVFTSHVSLASTILADIEAHPKREKDPEHIRCALRRLEGLVLLLRELIPHVIRVSGDVSSATDLLSVLVPASSVEFPLFAGVARLSLEILRQWSVSASVGKSLAPVNSFSMMHQTLHQGTCATGDNQTTRTNRSSPTCTSTTMHVTTHLAPTGEGVTPLKEDQTISTALSHERRDIQHSNNNANDYADGSVAVTEDEDARDTAEPLRTQLQGVARASIHVRNKAVLRRFLSNPSSREARQMAKSTLQTMLQLYPATQGVMNASEQSAMEGIMLELVRAVEYTDDDAVFRTLLSQSMMTVCTALGFKDTA